MLNEFQIHNEEILSEDEIEVIKADRYLDASASLLRCVSCGRHAISCGIVKFFHYDPHRLLCWSCQNRRLFHPIENVPAMEAVSQIMARQNY
jgi:heterodisulfide reductase subunit C